MVGWIAVYGLSSVLLGPLLGSFLRYGLTESPRAAPSEDQDEDTTSEQDLLVSSG